MKRDIACPCWPWFIMSHLRAPVVSWGWGGGILGTRWWVEGGGGGGSRSWPRLFQMVQHILSTLRRHTNDNASICMPNWYTIHYKIIFRGGLRRSRLPPPQKKKKIMKWTQLTKTLHFSKQSLREYIVHHTIRARYGLPFVVSAPISAVRYAISSCVSQHYDATGCMTLRKSNERVTSLSNNR